MSKVKEIIYNLSGKMLSGDISTKEKKHLDELLSNPENYKLFNELSQIWEAPTKVAEISFDSQEAYQKFVSQIGPGSLDNTVEPKVNIVKSALLALAAALILFLFFKYGLDQNSITHEYADSKYLELPDGSLVHLTQGATITYNTPMRNSRDIILKGKAYFQVTKAEIPFSVTADEIKVNVLGTSFIVDQSVNYVSVVEGKLLVSANQDDIILTTKESALLTKQGFSKEKEISFIEESIVQSESGYVNAPISRLLADLESRHQVNFKVNTDISNCYITSNSLEDSGLSEILEILKSVNGVQTSKIGENTYSILSSDCQ